MKKVLVTGAGGTIGTSVLKYLLSEGKYEITALDLKNKKIIKKLHKYRKRINIVYGDVLNRTLMEALIKDHDYIIHLASVLPPLAEYKEGISNIIEYEAIENILRAINYYNPNCHLIYASTTSLYNDDTNPDSKISISKNDYFNLAKYNSEKLISKKINNYVILRVPLVLGNPKDDNLIYNINKNTIVEVINKDDAAYAFVNSIKNFEKIKGNILNIGGGTSCRDYYNNILNGILNNYGFIWKMFLVRAFTFDTYKSPVIPSSSDSNKILNYQNSSLVNYYTYLNTISRKRKISKLIGKIVLLFKYKIKKL